MKKIRLFVAGAFIAGTLVSCEKEEVSPLENDTQGTNQTKEQVSGSGQGGSMAQFTIVDGYLYTIDYRTLKIFNLSDAANPALMESIDMGVGMETVFHENGRLFIGANNGVHIYDISNPRSPQELSEFDHVTSCDPVVANDQYAFATLRGGTACNGNINQLDIIDISDIYHPQLSGETQLINPYGLGISAVNPNILYICDGYDGFKAYDISTLQDNSWQIDLLMHKSDLEAIDVISTDDNNLIVLTRAGIYQFDSSNPTELVEKSIIPIQ